MAGDWQMVLTSTLVVGVALIYPTTKTLAQNITLDGTLGTAETLTGPDYQIPQSVGQTVGNNLFHSFGKFNLNANEAAIFSSGGNIRNILSRVTGGSPSSINGLIRTLGSDANFFLINPKGIVFGENARLDINGSFVASTANEIQFGNQGFFSATNPQPPSPLLTINPSALFFNQLQAQRIENRSIAPTGDNLLGLRVPDSRSLVLVGGDITIDGGRLNALGGRVELAGLAGDGKVGLNVDGNNLSLTVPDDVARGNVSLINGARVDVRAGGGGSITVNAQNLEIKERSILFAGIRSGFGTRMAQAGDITINATDTVSFNNGFVINNVESGAVGNAGDVSITTGSLEVINGAQLEASTFGEGDAANVTINANDLVKFDGEGGLSGAFSQVAPRAVGKAGGVSITTKSLEVANGAQLSASIFGEGDAGSVTINATDLVKFDGNSSGANSGVAPGAVGKAGGISITTKSLEVTNGAQLSASTFGEGDAGSVTINATDLVKFDGNSSGANSGVASEAEGNAGGVSITTKSLEVTNGAQLNASTFGEGDAGSVTINATNLVKFDGNGGNSGAFSQVNRGAVGKAGGVSITTKSLEVTNGAQFSASTRGVGDAGSVIINATSSVKFDGEGKDRRINSGAFSAVSRGAVGKAGGIFITTGSLEVTNGAFLGANTLGEGDAGSVTINATSSVKFDGEGKDGFNSGAFSQVSSRAVGKAGGVSITTNSLEVTNGAQLSAGTFGEGDGGSVTINAISSVKFDGEGKNGFNSGAFSNVGSRAVGKAGGVSITTGSLEVTNGAQLGATTRGVGDAGSVIINATSSVKFDGEDKDGFPSGAFSSVEPGAVGKAGGVSITTGSLEVTNSAILSASTLAEGDAGSVEITANTLEVSNGGQLVSLTSSQSSAGNIILEVKDNITLSGSDTGLFANTTEGSTGSGGNIFIDPRTVTIRDGATIAVDSQGEGIGGDIELAAGFLTLDNGTISAETRSNTGGDINLNLQDLLLLRNGSQISTTAGNQQFGGDGGNININTPFIVAFPKENSDITANAFTGIGGNVNISAISIFGINPQNRPTLLSDITASSEFGVSGEVTVNTPDIDPSRGLVELPSNLVDASEQIAQGCTPRVRQNASRFVSTGRGGLPLSPNQPLRGRAVITNWVDLPSAGVDRRIDKPPTASVTKSTSQIVAAQGWIVDDNGDIVLVAHSVQSSSSPSAIFCSQ